MPVGTIGVLPCACAGAIPPLVKMLFSGGRDEQMAAAAALNNLVAGNMENHA